MAELQQDTKTPGPQKVLYSEWQKQNKYPNKLLTFYLKTTLKKIRLWEKEQKGFHSVVKQNSSMNIPTALALPPEPKLLFSTPVQWGVTGSAPQPGRELWAQSRGRSKSSVPALQSGILCNGSHPFQRSPFPHPETRAFQKLTTFQVPKGTGNFYSISTLKCTGYRKVWAPLEKHKVCRLIAINWRYLQFSKIMPNHQPWVAHLC